MKKIFIIAVMLSVTGHAFGQSAKASVSSTGETNVSITNSDHDYSLIARFQSKKTSKIQKAIIAELGNPTENKDDLFVWFSQGSYTVTLRSEKLVIDLDKKIADAAMIQKFESLGERISDIVSRLK